MDHAGDIAARPWRWLLLGPQAASRAGKHVLVLKACGLGTDPAVVVSIADDVVAAADGHGVTTTAGAIRNSLHQRLRELGG